MFGLFIPPRFKILVKVPVVVYCIFMYIYIQ